MVAQARGVLSNVLRMGDQPAVRRAFPAVLILSVVSGYSDSSTAPVVALVLLALNLALKPEGIFAHNSARSV